MSQERETQYKAVCIRGDLQGVGRGATVAEAEQKASSSLHKQEAWRRRKLEAQARRGAPSDSLRFTLEEHNPEQRYRATVTQGDLQAEAFGPSPGEAESAAWQAFKELRLKALVN